MGLKFKIFNKSCAAMSETKDSSIKLVFTSPPYWDLKDYRVKEQIGYKQKYIEYLIDIKSIWTECYRVLDKSGVLCININSRMVKGKYYPIHLDFYNQLKEIGFKDIDTSIWHKASGIPTGPNRLTDRFEYIIIAAKERIVLNNIRYNDYKNRYLMNIKSWHIIKKAGSILSKHPHPAFYPVELVERGIKLFTKEGDVLLDPFLGSGSTLFAAFNLNRSCFGYEINPVYIKSIKETANSKLLANLEIII